MTQEEKARDVIARSGFCSTLRSDTNDPLDYADDILAALDEAGYVIMPKEPTSNMRGAGILIAMNMGRNGESARESIEAIWTAMLTAQGDGNG